MRNRLESAWVEPVSGVPVVETLSVGRLQYDGNWDPEPGAWQRFSNWFQRKTGSRLNVRSVRLENLTADDAVTYPVCHLTGNFKQSFSFDEVSAAKEYVEAGGTLFIDVCGGAGPFDQDVRQFLGRAFPREQLTPISPTHPLINLGRNPKPGMEDATRPRFRGLTLEQSGTPTGTLLMFKAGTGHVIFTGQDVTCGLLA